MTRNTVNAFCWLGLILFTLYLLRENNSYYRANTRTPTYDEAWYLETSLHLYHRLTGDGVRPFLDAASSAFSTKAPLISLLPVPFYLAFGKSYHSALLANSLLLAVSNLYLFLLVRRLFSAEAALAAVVFYQTMPLAYGLSRALMAEYGLAALVIVFLYYLVASDGLSRGSANFALGVVLGLGLLMKVLFPAFIAGPLLATWLARRAEANAPAPKERLWLWCLCARRPLAAIALPALLIAGPWYARNLAGLLQFAWRSAYGDVAGEYGAGGFPPWLLAFVNEGTSFWYALALVVLGAAALLSSRASRHGILSDHRTVLLLAWLLPPLVATAVAPNHLIRFILPLLPVFAIALAAAIFRLGRRRSVQALLALVIALYPLRLYSALSHYHHGSEHAARAGPFLLSATDLGWAHPPVWENPWDHRRLLEALRHLAPDPDTPQVVVVGVEHVYLNANLLGYLNAYDEYPLQFTSFGYGEASPERALERLYALDARFLILGAGFRDLPPFLNQVNDSIRARIERRELPFALRAAVPLAHQMTAQIFERESPWAAFPPGASAPAPSHVLTAEFAGGLGFLGYDYQRRDRYLLEISSYWTAREPLGQDYRLTLELRRGAASLLTRHFYLTNRRHVLPEWQPGEVVKDTQIVYLPADQSGAPAEVRLQLVPWGAGPVQPVLAPPEFAKDASVAWTLVE